MNAKQHVLIIGGGFGGVKAALEILKQDRYRVTLITDREDFEYHPTLYKVATGRSRVLSKIPLAEVFKEKRIRIIVDTAVTLDRKTKTVTTQKGGVYRYNIVILALGMVTNYFGIEGLDTYSFGIKSLADAEKLKRHLHEQLTNKQTSAEHCVVVGGGPTGIELSCELPEYIRHIEEQHGLSTRSKVHVDLIEAAPRLLPRMHPAYHVVLQEGCVTAVCAYILISQCRQRPQTHY
jgi:NADH dehydrogenase